MFDTVLVANRGEIAVRVLRTLRDLGVRSVAVYSDADADARHVREADLARRLGAAPAAESYLSIERVIDAAVTSGATAIHPGYGFLAESAGFARACAAAGLAFVGPSPEAIEAMGDKIRARGTVTAAGVPVVPGRGEPGLGDGELVAAASEIGFPVLVKPAAGGGGKGMRLVREPAAMPAEIAAARREARSAFGDDTLLVERYVDRPRHVEVQVLADAHGNVVHLGERECSLQRRHQKIVEEAPSPLLDATARAAVGASAVEAARACGYAGAGTVEFVVGAGSPDEFFFLEMNTRLQVEHPVTELVTGLDLVECQLRVAAGEPLTFTQDGIHLDGHAVEARVYAEDPARGFLPTGGTVLALEEPRIEHVRVDSGLRTGATVGTDYDPMLAKVVAWGPGRDAALRRLDGALARTAVLGLGTNVAFLRALLAHPEVRAGRLDTGLVERHLGELVAADVPDAVYAAAALERLLALWPDGPVEDPWEVPSGWRLGEPGWAVWRVRAPGHDPVEVRARARGGRPSTGIAAEVCVAGGAARPATARLDGDTLAARYAGEAATYTFARGGDVLWLAHGGRTHALREQERLEAARVARAGAATGEVRSPMPGTVLAVKAAEGEEVAAGQALLVVEAMKMEQELPAPISGTVAALHVRPGQRVTLEEKLADVTAGEG